MNPRTLLLLVFLFAVPAAAQSNELALSVGHWDSAQLGNAPAIGASYNRYWTRMFSTRAGGFISREGDVTAGAVHLSGELHLFRASRVSPWVGAGGAQAYQSTAASDDYVEASETSLTGIYRGGVDVSLSPRFALGAEVSYMNYEVSLRNRFGYSVDPVTILLTGRWRY